jgi:hypothetical protein
MHGLIFQQSGSSVEQLERLKKFTYQIKKALKNSKLIQLFDVIFSLQEREPVSFTDKDKTKDPIDT